MNPHWTGSFGCENPHIIRKLNDVPAQKQRPLIVEVAERYHKAVELLKSIRGTKRVFSKGIPLCPVIVPTFSPMEQDDISKDKIGGMPNPHRHWLYKAKEPQKLKKYWPRCGTCHEYMSFLGQFDLSNEWDAIHKLTSITDKYGHFSYSSVGIGENERLSSFMRDGILWSFWMCADACQHFYSSQFDAFIWTEKYLITDEEMRKYLPEEKRDENELAIGWAKATEVVGNFIADNNVKHYPVSLKKVESLAVRFELDSSYEYEVSDRLDKVMENNVDVFAQWGKDFKMFGRPRSQQTEARFFGLGNRCPHPYRLSPVLCWDDEEHDITYQMYADVLHHGGEGYRDMFAKIDASNT